ncbi:MAG: OmpA family protein [Cyclobacteriaceae bacterium]
MKRLFILIMILVSFNPAMSQNALTSTDKKAIKFYNEAGDLIIRRQFNAAIVALTKAISKDPNFTEAHLRKAGIFRTLVQYDEAAKHYQAAIDSHPDHELNQSAYFYLGDHNFYSGNYQDAKQNLERYLSYENLKPKNVDKVKWLLSNAEFSLQGIQNPVDFNAYPLPSPLNQFKLQYFPVLTVDNNTIIFTRRLGTQPHNDEDIYVSSKNADNQWTEPISISRNINTRTNEGTCSISADGKLLMFTSCQGPDSFGSCDLYVSRKSGDQWSLPENVGEPINSKAWESQPSLSADGRTLYFVSNRGGGHGKRDIWVSSMSPDGSWGEPRNLGDRVNTKEDDISPFIHVNGQSLYFASEGHLGFGGLDLYLTEKQNGDWKTPSNLGYPLNDHQDQASLFISSEGLKGYYSHEESDVLHGLISGQIYEFDVPVEARIKKKSTFLTGRVMDSETNEFISAELELFELASGALVSKVNSDDVDGTYLVVLSEGGEYGIYITAPGYIYKNVNFNFVQKPLNEPEVLDIYLDPIKKGVKTVLNNIFFDYDKYDLKEKSITELGEVVKFLNANPGISIEVGGHTDDVGSDVYNKELSQKRAQSVVDYLVSNGVAADRILSKGYGSDDPIAPNDNDENRAQNRRIEFKIL